ncbi:MAG: aldehyde ferredoxin oxidoreductase family protein [Spirochaetales bacterium]
MENPNGYMGKILRVDLSRELLTEESLPEATLRHYIGGTGLGVKIMYEEVPAGIEWSSPENRIIWTAGVLAGTKAPGSGTYAVATKGPLTNLFVASHANGFFGSRLKFAGYDTIIVQGAAERWLYLYVHDGVAELRDAEHLLGKDTWDTEELLKKEIGEIQASVSCIGPAGENLVKYAAICSDRGHIAATNGCGAVMGSKKLKAIVVHGKAAVPIHDKDKLNALIKEWWKQTEDTIWGMIIPSMGTNGQVSGSYAMNIVPVKNYTAYDFPTHEKFDASGMREYYHEGKPKPCYACRFAHCRELVIQSGPHKGAIVEESEFEGTVAFSSQIGNFDDVDGAQWLNNLNDRLGMDAKEQAFVMGLAIECYEKGLITTKDTDGVELTWGNVLAVETMINKIARRDGFGDVLAEGVMRAAQKIGGEAPNFAVYTHKGNAPHVHDDRGMWSILFSMAVSDMGSIPCGDMGDVGDLNDEIGTNALDPTQAFAEDMVPKGQAINGRRGHFIDCLGVCMFVSGVPFVTIADTVSAVTGWDFTWREAADVGWRVMTMMRAFNIRHGMTREHNHVSPRILEAPTQGVAAGISAAPKFDQMLDTYYETMGWDMAGRPLPETLKRLGLESVAQDLGI